VRLDGLRYCNHRSIGVSLNGADSRYADPTARILLCFRNSGYVVLPVEQPRYIWLANLVRRGKRWRWSSGAGVKRELVNCYV
jgi:hypothetical protein